MNLKELLKHFTLTGRRSLWGIFDFVQIEKESFEDLHIMRFYSSFVAVSKGKVIKLTDPYLEHCPLVSFLYKGMRNLGRDDLKLIKEAITKAVEEKISKFGFFTEKCICYFFNRLHYWCN